MWPFYNNGYQEELLIQKNKILLSALIEWCIESEKHFEPTSLFEKTIGLLERSTGKTWDEIKELI